MFPESINHFRLRRHRLENFVEWVKAGKESYYIVSKFEHFEYAKVAPLFASSRANFEGCVYGLNMVKNDLEEMQHPIVRRDQRTDHVGPLRAVPLPDYALHTLKSPAARHAVETQRCVALRQLAEVRRSGPNSSPGSNFFSCSAITTDIAHTSEESASARSVFVSVLHTVRRIDEHHVGGNMLPLHAPEGARQFLSAES
jgi:hypothetical protein